MLPVHEVKIKRCRVHVVTSRYVSEMKIFKENRNWIAFRQWSINGCRLKPKADDTKFDIRGDDGITTTSSALITNKQYDDD